MVKEYSGPTKQLTGSTNYVASFAVFYDKPKDIEEIIIKKMGFKQEEKNGPFITYQFNSKLEFKIEEPGGVLTVSTDEKGLLAEAFFSVTSKEIWLIDIDDILDEIISKQRQNVLNLLDKIRKDEDEIYTQTFNDILSRVAQYVLESELGLSKDNK